MNRLVYRLGLLLAALTLLAIVAACAQAPAPAAQPAPKATEAPKAVAPTTAPAAAATTAPVAPKATDAPKSAAPTTASAAPKATDAPKAAATTRGAGGQLRMLYWQAPTILNPHLAQGTKDYHASGIVLEPLAWLGPDGKPVPALTAEIPTVQNGGVSADLKTVTWKLKPGVKWSDGSDFTSADVVFTYTYCADPATACTNAAQTRGVDKVEAVDPLTVRVTYQNPNPNPYQLFTASLFMILQKKQFEGFVGAAAKDAPGNLLPIGTNAYKVKEFKPGDVVLYEINPNYRDAAKPFFKEIQLKGGGDATSAARAVFQTGETDYAWNLQVPAAVFNPLVQAPNSRADLIISLSSNVERILVNFADPNSDVGGAKSEPTTKHPILSDLKVRQALSLAIDRKKVAEQLYGPAGQATCNIVSGSPEYDSKNTICTQDLAKANALLDEAGWTKGADGIRQKDGVRFKLLFQTSVNPVRQSTQDLVKADWAQLGVETELKAINAGVYFSSDVGNPDTASKFYADIQMFTNGSTFPDYTNFLAGWTTAEITQKSNEWRGNNYHRWSNAEYDAIVQQLRTESDAAKRKDLIVKANDLLVNNVVVMPLVARTSPTSGKAKDLKGIVPNSWDTELWNIQDWSK